MSAIRPAAVAGMFYPANPALLQSNIESMLAEARITPQAALRQPKALVVPHAGYIYSGPIAAQAYARLIPWRAAIRRVILLGPAHQVALRGIAVPDAEAFATPLGKVRLDTDAAAWALQLPQVVENGAAHAPEHSLEVQLPFLQSVLDDFRVLPLVVGLAEPKAIAEVVNLLWGGAETLIVVSSDLSHYHSYREAQTLDRHTADSILALDAHLDHEQACGAAPLSGLLLAARHRGLVPQLLDLRNSGDTAGERSRVVGYASFAFYEDAAHVH
jgi:MEMO1 family protein